VNTDDDAAADDEDDELADGNEFDDDDVDVDADVDDGAARNTEPRRVEAIGRRAAHACSMVERRERKPAS
jgi:hypothetical protein